MGLKTIKRKGYECNRCGHQWEPRKSTQGEPKVCPKCKNPYWNKARRVKKIKV